MHVQELLFASTSWQVRAAFRRALALNPARRKNFFSRFYFHRYISLKILQTKLFNRSDQGQARRYTQRLSRLHYRLAIFSFASFLSFSGDFYRFWQFSFVSLLSVAVWRSFTNDHWVILRDRRKHVKIYSDNKIAVPLSVFVSRSLIYTLGT